VEEEEEKDEEGDEEVEEEKDDESAEEDEEKAEAQTEKKAVKSKKEENVNKDKVTGEAETKTQKKSKKGKKLMERQAERLKNKIVIKKDENDEYVYDSSDEEDIRNTIGNIPVNWYDDYDHIGYDWDGKPIRKPKRGDELDKFLNR